MVPRFGLIGRGVVGSFFARLLCTYGAKVASYDVLLGNGDTAEQCRKQIAADGAHSRTTLEQTIRESEYILSSGRRHCEVLELM